MKYHVLLVSIRWEKMILLSLHVLVESFLKKFYYLKRFTNEINQKKLWN